MRVAVPTKDRSGNLAVALTALAQSLRPNDELFLYDDGDRPATADYATRFALDMALRSGVSVRIVRGIAQGIAAARVNILMDALRDDTQSLLMVDDDIILSSSGVTKLYRVFDDYPDAQYSVPVIALANNEAGVTGFTKTSSRDASHQQYVLGAKGAIRMDGGAWTCAILLNLDRTDLSGAISRLAHGPKVVEDYALTVPLIGYVQQEATVWHIMSNEQGERGWESLALEELRKQIGG